MARVTLHLGGRTGPGRRVPRAESTSRHAVLQLQGEDGGTEDGAGLPRRALQPPGAVILPGATDRHL